MVAIVVPSAEGELSMNSAPLRLTRDAWVAVVGFGLVGLGLGMCIADFAVHWMGWDGPTTVAMMGALIAWSGVYVTGLVSHRQRRKARPAN
jgi:hypothetical protein